MYHTRHCAHNDGDAERLRQTEPSSSQSSYKSHKVLRSEGAAIRNRSHTAHMFMINTQGRATHAAAKVASRRRYAWNHSGGCSL